MSRRRSKVDNTQLAIGLGLIAIMLAIVGWGLPLQVDSQITRNGSTTISISAGSNFGTGTATFSPPFPTGTTLIRLGYWQIDPSNLAIPLLSATGSFLSVNTPQTWSNMPSGGTPQEIFGNANSRLLLDLSQTQGFTFMSNTVTASNNFTGSPTIRIEYSLDLSNWHELANAPTCGDISIMVAGVTTSGINCLINPAAKTTSTFLRISGFYGGGIGDNPQFSELKIFLYAGLSSMQATFLNCGLASCTVKVIIPVVLTGGIGFTLTWRASGCAAGLSC